MKKHIKKTLTENVLAIVTYQRKTFSTKFNFNDRTEFYHQNKLGYYEKCRNPTCTEDYMGEADHRINERIIDHNKCDKNPHILKHSSEECHTHVWNKDF